MQDVGQSEALAKQSFKYEKWAFSCEKYGLAGLGASPGSLSSANRRLAPGG
jgi:hypothetical protein